MEHDIPEFHETPWTYLLARKGKSIPVGAESGQRLRPRVGFSMPSLRIRERSVLA